MRSKHKKKAQPGAPEKHSVALEVEGTASGIVAGAALGAAAGPPGIVAGVVLGGAAGAIMGTVLEQESEREARHGEALDSQIGVSGGDLGAPTLAHPRATVGAYSAASAGAGGPSAEQPAEGPMQVPDE